MTRSSARGVPRGLLDSALPKVLLKIAARIRSTRSESDAACTVATFNGFWRSGSWSLAYASCGAEPDRRITARLVLTHTLAHILIGEWALDSGYPAASLRERLYVSGEHAGMLLYTGSSDSAGSLGGVLAQAAPDRFEASLRDALERAAWCSSDPICIEAEAQGVDSLNLAACHACVLLPEVSCEEMNVLLDRALVIGTPEDASIGFFAG